jgi:glutathione peroxidase
MESAKITPLKWRLKLMGLRFSVALCVIALTGLMSLPAFAAQPIAPLTAAACPTLLQHQFPKLQDESPQNLCQYAGKVILVVNTASYCGFTSQYEGLEALFARFEKRGLVVLGFPSNDFGRQEPGSSKEIADFCFNTYGVKFPMFAKSVVSGPKKSSFYSALEKATGKSPQWNFHKYLIDRSGQVIASFPSDMDPLNPKLLNTLERAL